MPNGSTVMIPIARLGRDPELRTVGAHGKSVCDLWIAWDDWSGQEKRTNWSPVTVWGDPAVRVAESLEKGSKISVTGHLRSEEYESRDGGKRRAMKIVADSIQFLSPRRAAAADQPSEPSSRQGKRAA